MKLDFNYEHATIKRVIDGDTIEIEVDLGFKIKTCQIFRLARINAPEMKTQEGPLSKEFIENNFKGINCRFTSRKSDRNARYIAEIFIIPYSGVKEVNLNDFMVEKGYAVYQEY